MKNTPKWVKITYIENSKARDWMRKNLGNQEQSSFIRDAVSDKINNKTAVR